MTHLLLQNNKYEAGHSRGRTNCAYSTTCWGGIGFLKQNSE